MDNDSSFKEKEQYNIKLQSTDEKFSKKEVFIFVFINGNLRKPERNIFECIL